MIILDSYYSAAAKLANDSIEGIGEGLDLIINNSSKIKEMQPDIPEGSLERLHFLNFTGIIDDQIQAFTNTFY